MLIISALLLQDVVWGLNSLFTVSVVFPHLLGLYV